VTGGPLPLRATYRLQFTPDFGFLDAARIAPYLARLGVSHVYASPIFAARPGSRHGYDGVDPTRLNPELGTDEEFAEMSAAFRAEGLGLILDFVPNHMGVGRAANPYWSSLLEWGRASPFARWFDIDWESPYPGLAGRILVPFLGSGLATALRDGSLALRFDPVEAAFAVWAHDTHKLPVRPADYAAILRAGGARDLADTWEGAEEAGPDSPRLAELRAALRTTSPATIEAALAAHAGTPGDQESWSALAALIDRQHWRPARFTMDNEAINYRRFFTISELAGLRIEDPAVFDVVHHRLFELIARGHADGIRIDHVDGLRDPKAYLLRLRAEAPAPVHLFVEKILARDERLREDWNTDGTTGYEVANLLVGLFVDPAAEPALTACWADFTGRTLSADAEARIAKHEIMQRAMASELDALVRRLQRLPEAQARDLGPHALRAALAATIAAFDLYRTYADADAMTEADRARVAGAIARARATTLGLDPEALELIEAVLTLVIDRPETREIAFRAQQLTGPVMAKGFEDTALYRTTRLIALNEVGGASDRFGLDIAVFHAANAERLTREPRALLATSTHDTKRGEDARMRIAAISWAPELWRQRVPAWRDLLATAGAPAIDGNTLYFFLQLLLGVWPADAPEAGPLPGGALETLRTRVAAAMQKSVREAALHTRWTFGDPDYEDRIDRLVATALDPGGRFLASFREAASVFGRIGAANAIAQTALKLTIPGTPDIYQGAELWEQSLVDPDNRRPVDFATRATVLAAADSAFADAPRLTAATKLALIARLLGLRRDRPALFAHGSYEPVPVSGPEGRRICAFRRREGDDVLLVAVALGWRGDAEDPLTRFDPPELASDRGAIDPISAPPSEHAFANLPVFLRWRDRSR
jgi:(1->4)-alpha-D-glucan 1-alpha-D-glucosylmutase